MKDWNAAKCAVCLAGALLMSVTASGQYKAPAGFAFVGGDEILAGPIFGDPTKPGLYVARSRFMPGQGSTPHYHDQDRYLTVIKGTWWVALGPDSDVYNPDKMTALKPGGFVFEPAGGHHYDMAKDEEVIVQSVQMGPMKTIPLTEPPGGWPGAPPRPTPPVGPGARGAGARP